jgi:hypothetical protein
LFTVEFEKDSAILTVICEQDRHEDVEVIVGDNGDVFIRQYQEYKNEYDVLVMTWEQLKDICYAINSPEGVFVTKRKSA